MIITIDGPASAGKGTLASTLAGIYHLAYFDTGMVYRAVGLDLRLKNQDINDEALAEASAKGADLCKNDRAFQTQGVSLLGRRRCRVGSFRSTEGSRCPAQKCSRILPRIRLSPTVRRPKAPFMTAAIPAPWFVRRQTSSFFITASSEVRAKRRFKELQEKGIDTPYEKVLADIVSRDERDSQRSTAPLKAAPDAHIIDTSNMDIDEVVAKAREIIENHKESA